MLKTEVLCFLCCGPLKVKWAGLLLRPRRCDWKLRRFSCRPAGNKRLKVTGAQIMIFWLSASKQRTFRAVRLKAQRGQSAFRVRTQTWALHFQATQPIAASQRPCDPRSKFKCSNRTNKSPVGRRCGTSSSQVRLLLQTVTKQLRVLPHSLVYKLTSREQVRLGRFSRLYLSVYVILDVFFSGFVVVPTNGRVV